MKRDEALKLLGLEPGNPISSDIVQAAFRQRVKLAHPDTAGDSQGVKYSVQQLTMAKKMLLESAQGTDLCCRLCAGRGMVRSGMGFRDCVACKGTGERR